MDSRVDIKENFIYQIDEKLLEILLKDHSSKKNIIWATDNYSSRGTGYQEHDNITLKSITGRNGLVIKPRIKKSKKEQDLRIKAKAEVFTPSWICNKMANDLDNVWFERENVFNTEQDLTWITNRNKITFPNTENKTWQDYVKSNRMEITCGEAPYLVSRYDTVTGLWIDVNERIGLLDRKLRVVNENTDNEEDWFMWVQEAYKATFAFEWQGDSLLIARENLIFTFIDYYLERFRNYPSNDLLINIANILSWNIWQMDGLKYVIPNSCKPVPKMQMSIFEDEKPEECIACKKGNSYKHIGIYSKIKNWKTNRTIIFNNIKGENKMKFDFIIGNPPYQDKGGSGGNNDAPIYQNFIMSSKDITSKAMSFIIPARWFSAGRDNLLGSFRNYMMNTKHLKSMTVYTDSHLLFSNVEIKGGICYFILDNGYEGKCNYTYHDDNIKDNRMRDLGEFEVIIRDPFKANIVSKVLTTSKGDKHLDVLISNDTPFGIPSNPKTSEKTLFPVYEISNVNHNTLLYHIENQKRKVEYVSRTDIKKNTNYIDTIKVFIPGAGGSGNDSLILGKPELAPKNSVCSQSYLFASFKSEIEAKNFIRYLKTKFLRILLSALKISQSAPKRCYRFIPLQNFASTSDIDWSKTIHEIDLQLYKKYKLDENEINFIEKHVKEMD